MSPFERAALSGLSRSRPMVWGLVVGTLLAASAPARDLWDSEYAQMLRQIPVLVAANSYEEALQNCRTMIPWLEGRINDPEVRSKEGFKKGLEYCVFTQGAAELELGRYPAAVESLKVYLSRFPGGSFRTPAALLIADALAMQEDWQGVLRTVDPLDDDARLTRRQRLAVNKLQADGLFRLERWKDAVPPLLYVYRNERDGALRADAAATIATCLVRLGKFEALYKFLPNVYLTEARYDAGLNIALIEEGDRQYNEGETANALLLYRPVYPKKELIREVKKRIRNTRRDKDRLVEHGEPEELRQIRFKKRRLGDAVQRMEAQLTEIEAYPDYDEELTLRVGSSYFELSRYREALVVYYGIYQDSPQHPLAQQALYGCFTVAYAMKDPDLALAYGYEYLQAYPGGDYYDPLSLNMVQLHMQRAEFEEALALGVKALEISPEHTSIDTLTYLVGFAHFQLEHLEHALIWLARVVDTWPDSVMIQPATYWHAMAQLFLGRYPDARDEFAAFLSAYPQGLFYEDASYRLPVAYYGLGDFETSAQKFERFIERFPEALMKSTAYGMLADIKASWGKLDEALADYKEAEASATDQVQANYAVFQAARTYELELRFDEIITLFRDYLKTYGKKGNFTEATYWIGTALLRLQRMPEALDLYFDTIIEYGDNPRHFGIDMILRDLIAMHEQLQGRPEHDAFMERLYQELGRLRGGDQRTLYLRLVSLFAQTLEPEVAGNRPMLALTQKRNIPVAAPITLALMGEEATRQGKTDFAREVFEHFLTEYGDSDLVVSALRGMVEIDLREENWDPALVRLDELANRFATLPEAGWAQVRLADIHRARGNQLEAIDAYQVVLSVKEWKGELWPEALHGIGLCNLDQGKAREAFAFFQRVYVMYAGYPDWAARSYLKSAECLVKLDKPAEAADTYREMLEFPAMTALPEAAQARKALAALEGGS